MTRVRALSGFVLSMVAVATLIGCASRITSGTAPDQVRTAAKYAAQLTSGIKVIAQTLVASEATQTPLTPAQSAFYGRAYIATYEAADVAAQVADLLVVAESAAITQSVADRLNTLLPLLDGKVAALAGIDMGPANQAELARLVGNVRTLVQGLRQAVPQLQPTPVLPST